MERKITLDDYSLHDLHSVVNAVIAGELTFYALIHKQRNQYFLPMAVSFIEEVPGRFRDEVENSENSYQAQTGKYEICDTESIIRKLEQIYEIGTSPDPHGPVGGLEKLRPKQVKSSAGEKGCLVEKRRLGYMTGYNYRFVQVPFTRILVEQASNPDLADWLKASGKDENDPESIPPKRTRSNPIKILIFRYFAKANGVYDFDRCMDHVLEDHEVDERDGRIFYTSFNGKPQNPLRKSIQSRYNIYLKEWKSLNP